MLTYHFPPSAASGAFRLLGFARYLPAREWCVGVVAPPTLPWEPNDPQLLASLPAETVIFAAPYRELRASKPIRYVAPYAYWLLEARRVARRALASFQPDVLLTSGPPHLIHMLGSLLARGSSAKWVADFRDPWLTGNLSLARPGPLDRHMERHVLARADLVLWNTPRVLDYMRRAFPVYADRMACISNGYDPEAFPAPTRDRAAVDELEIVHAGMIYFGRDPTAFLDALARLGDGARRFRAAFIGLKANFTVNVDEVARARGLTNVEVEGHIPFHLVVQRLVNADILLLLDTPGRLLGVPAKLYEYMGAGRPILALCEADSDTATILRQSGSIHRIAHPDDAPAIAAALTELAGAAETEPVHASRSPGRFTREETARSLADLLDQVVRSDDAGAVAVRNANRP
jgi:glycosyltransferase involved in cell wall biosynthesis